MVNNYYPYYPQVFAQPMSPLKNNFQPNLAAAQMNPVQQPYTQAPMPVYTMPAAFATYKPQTVQNYNTTVAAEAYTPQIVISEPKQAGTPIGKVPSILERFSQHYSNVQSAQSVQPTQNVQPPQAVSNAPYKNDLKTLFLNNKAVIYAMVPRIFNAKDKNGDEIIQNNEEHGTFINAIERLDELKGYGINTIHMLPIHEPGQINALGAAGSLYAPKDYLDIDPMLDDKNNPKTVKEEFKQFVDECHKRGIKVMIDLPSCASVDLYNSRPDLMATDEKGNPKTPQGWVDIRMFNPWEDESKRILNKNLVDYHKKYVDMCLELGIDGIRADVARAKPVEFWDEIIPYARSKDPEFAFLAESYTYEDASPMLNMPKDRPEDLLRAGFDSYYGQYHIFNEWSKASEFNKYVEEQLEMSKHLPKGKSLIGSFATHDDKSPMSNGGVSYCNLTTGLQMTLPMLNPYYVTGFESGDKYIYSYKDKEAKDTPTGNNAYFLHNEKLDIFNMSRKPGGENPEIGKFMSNMSDVRKKYEDVITKGSYIPLTVRNDQNDKVIAYARHLNGKTILVVANKDVNAFSSGVVKIPGLKPSQPLNGLSMEYTAKSELKAGNGEVEVSLAPASFYVFEIDTPNIEKEADKVLKQNL